MTPSSKRTPTANREPGAATAKLSVVAVVKTTRTPGAVSAREDADAVFRNEGCSAPSQWGNGPGDTYGRHSHAYHKVLFCLDGSITFHTREGDVELRPGDRLDIAPGTEHAATVGDHGVSCVEAVRR